MNFEEMKEALNSDSNELELPLSLDKLKESQLPFDSIRKTIKGEIITQLVCIVIFYLVLFVVDLKPLSFSVYLIFITIICIFTGIYLAKLIGFLNRSAQLALNTRASIYSLIYDLKLTLEVYKTAVTAGSIMLPIPMAALVLGKIGIEESDIFEKYFLFQGTTTESVLIVLAFFALGIFFYVLTVWWANKLYGTHIDKLEVVLKELGE